MTDGFNYEQWQSGVLAPTWLRRAFGFALESVLGAVKDLIAAASKEAVKARFVAEAATDALAYIGSERNIERYPNEGDESYRGVLANAWTVWEFAGTAIGLKAALAEAGYTNATVYNTFAPPSWWVSEGFGVWPPTDPWTLPGASWSRFWIELNAPFGALVQPVRWGDGHVYEVNDWTWGSSAFRSDVELVRAIVNKWRAGHERCAEFLVRIPNGMGGFYTARWPS